jgi:HD-GYP domain-containing protein (c-di-GMP phosphodiesterase class II)
VERVALFHDVGKIHAALFDIIHDPTGLSDEERKAVRTHPARGAEVLEPLTAFYPDLAAGVLAHHERWDGTGYPRALRGEQIPMAARIVAIADTFDAVSASRRYHRGAGVEKAARVIADGRGTQFDPALTDLFLRDDVFARVKRLARTADRKRKPAHRSDRRRQSLERSTPSVTFRWRDELQSG